MTEIQNEEKFLQESKEKIKSIVKDLEIQEVIYGIIDFLTALPISSSVKSISYIRDKSFVRKLSKFLYELEDLSGEEIETFCIDLETDPKYGKKVGENIILLLDRADHDRKAELIGKTFKASIEKHIDAEDLQRIWNAIDKNLVIDLDKLKEFYKKPSSYKSNDILIQSFLSSGLATRSILSSVSSGVGSLSGEGIYVNSHEEIHPTNICKLFCEHVLK